MQKRPILKVLAVLLAVVTVLSVGLVIALRSVNLGQIKELLIAQIKSATGRTLTINGPLDLKMGLIPRLVADGVTVSNPPGSTRPDMVTIKHFEMEISLLPLLKREILINRLVVSAPDILIETEAKGPGNLNFSDSSKKSAPMPSAAEGSSAYRFNLREISIENAVMARHDRRTGQTESVEIQKLTVQPDRSSSGRLAVQLTAKARGHMVKINGTVGRLDAALDGKPWPVNLKVDTEGLSVNLEGAITEFSAFHGLNLRLTAQGEELYTMVQLAGIAKSGMPQALGPFKISAHLSDASGALTLADVEAVIGKQDLLLLNAKGSIADLLGARNVNFALVMESTNLANLSQLAGSDIPALGPLKLSGLLKGNGTVWQLADFKASLAGSDISGQMAVDISKRPHLSGKLAANILNLNDFTTSKAQGEGQPAAKQAKTGGGDGRIFSNQPLPIPDLRSLDADLTLHAGKLMTGEMQLTDISMELHVSNGRLSLKPFQTVLAGGTLEGEVNLDATGKVPVLVLHVTGRQIELGKLTDHKTISGGKSDLKVDLKGQGESVRALMASMSGETILSVGEGKVQNKAMNWAAGDLLYQVLGALNPLAKSENTTSLSCAAARFTLRDGIATTDKGIAVRTDKVDVVGSGTVDLRGETLDLGIRPRPREGVGLSLSNPLAGMTRLRGTFTNPSIGIDNEGTLRSAASMGAAAATGGLSLLGELLVDKVSADSDPCRTALGQGPAQQKGQKQKQKDEGLFQGMFGR